MEKAFLWIDDINRWFQSVAGADQPKSNAVCSKGALESEFSTLREFSNEDRNLQRYIRGFVYIKALFLIRIKFSCSVMSDSLRRNGLQHARLPCPSPNPGVCSNSCPSSWWCHPTIPSSLAPFPFCPQIFPTSGSFTMSQLFVSGGQVIGASVLVLPLNIQGWLPLGLTGYSPCSRRDSQESSLAPLFEDISSSEFFMVQYSHPYMTTRKNIALNIQPFFGKVMSLFFF